LFQLLIFIALGGFVYSVKIGATAFSKMTFGRKSRQGLQVVFGFAILCVILLNVEAPGANLSTAIKIEEHILDTNTGKQVALAATDI
jgi:hypothetical protein